MNDTKALASDPGVLVLGLLKVAEMIEEHLNTALEPNGLSLAKFGVLQALVQAGEPLPLGVLSERLGCVKSNVTQLVDRLEGDDLVQRIADPQDRRTKLASITPQGRQRHDLGRRAFEKAQQDVLASLPEDERAQLAVLIARFGG